MAAFRLNASINAVSWSTRVLPTLRTSMPSVVMPTLNSVENICMITNVKSCYDVVSFYDGNLCHS